MTSYIFPPDLLREIKTLSYYHKNLEVEIRLGHYENNRWKNGISKSDYTYLLTTFGKNLEVHPITTTDYLARFIRKQVDNEGKEKWIEKKPLWKKYLREYSIKVSVSREKPISPIPNMTFTMKRKKTRHFFHLSNHTFRLDLTKVEIDQHPPQYEAELELLDITAIDQLEETTSLVLKAYYQSFEVYREHEKSTIIQYVNDLLGGWKQHPYDPIRQKTIIDDHLLTQVRNLKMTDLVWGGLIGNPSTSYVVSHKVDGIRKMLVFHPSGIWLLNAPSAVSKISSVSDPEINGTILDGEYIPPERRRASAPDTLVWFIGFDVLSSTKLRNANQYGDTSIQKLPLPNRLNYLQSMADRYKNPLLFITTKVYRELVSPDQTFEINGQMIADQDILPYYQDVLIFTPVQTPYNPHSEYFKLSQRVLTKHPDICKWKPPKNLTIDFAYYGTSKEIKVLPFHSQGTLEVFKGTSHFPFDRSMVDFDHPLTKDLEDGVIVEYKWDDDTQLFEPLRIRTDKMKPNRIDFAMNIWEDINNPITQDIIKGESFILMRKYHNRIKRELYYQVGTREGMTLLDIGSGRGGDVSKWSKFSKVIAVEPNLEHLEELKRRIKAGGMEDKVRIVQAGGEETEKISQVVKEFIGGRVSVISLMLSMSFFWSSKDKVQALGQTILSNLEKDGKVIFLTIDGDIVQEVFEPTSKNGIPLKSLVLGGATLVKEDRKLFINIPETIVSHQEEYLVYLDDLSYQLDPHFQLSFIRRADKERFLSSAEERLSLLYSYGIFSSTTI